MSFKAVGKKKCDVLIIGGGGAGLRASIAAAASGADVLIVSKTRIGYTTNTYLSKAIIASSGWGDANDTKTVHGLDTLKGGRYLNNPDMVDRFVGMIPSETAKLQEWGVAFCTGEDNRPSVMKIPGHSFARHIAGKNWKGSDLILPLKQKARNSGVRFEERMFVSSLIVSENRVSGATCISEDNRFLAIAAKTVILATGGFGHIYLNTNNAPGITGDGQALAVQAGVTVQDMEFVQYYPTALGKRGSRILLYERLLAQAGVVLRNNSNEDILKKNGYDVTSDINRDKLAQIIMKELLNDPDQKTTVHMDLSGLSPEAAQTLSNLLPPQWAKGIKVFQVTPTTHFCMGGVVVDSHGETSCQGLFAAGEVTTGAHGANRLGGNALAEVIAMGGLVGKVAAERALGLDKVGGFDTGVQQERDCLEAMFGKNGPKPKTLVQDLKETMWLNAGIVKSQASLDKALATLMSHKDLPAAVETSRDLIQFLEFKNMRLVGEMVCRSALERTESRGSHFREDYPVENEKDWLVNIRVTQKGSRLVLKTVPAIQSSEE